MLHYTTSQAPLTPDYHDFALQDDLRLIGIKVSSGDLTQLQQLIESVRSPSFHIYYGRERDMLEAFRMGIDGIVPGTGNLCPELFVQLWDKKEASTMARINEIKKSLEANCPGNYLEGLKKALENQHLLLSQLTQVDP